MNVVIKALIDILIEVVVKGLMNIVIKRLIFSGGHSEENMYKNLPKVLVIY